MEVTKVRFKNLYKKYAKRIGAAALATLVALGTVSMEGWTVKGAQSETPRYAAVHDPSIIKDEETGKYYIVGSHQAMGVSTDLINWGDYGMTDLYAQDVRKELKESLEWAGFEDGSTNAGLGLALWAASAIYNPYYQCEDGSKGSYMIYYPASSNYKRGCIGYAVSDKVVEGYKYVDTIMYSGFTVKGGPDEATCEDFVDTNYERTNLGEMIEAGKLQWKDDYITAEGDYNIGSYPQAIDPTVFFDKDDNLWMIYGSHGGGIWLLPLDRATGQPQFLTDDQVAAAKAEGKTADNYFGYKLTSEGEGPYLIYDKTSDYYYMTVTYGQITEGYNMRLFRSQSVTGPYVDAAGNEAVYKAGQEQDDLGVKLMGNYNLLNTPKYMHGGHNSILIEDGQIYNIYHQRFADNTTFRDAIHQMFRNKNGWLCMAVYQNAGSVLSETGYDKSEYVGTYQFINHGSVSSSTMLPTYTVYLNEDGSVTGDIDGVWSYENGTAYMAMEINGVKYDGVFFKQQDESGKPNEVMTFTAIGNNNEAIWGSKVSEEARKSPVTDTVTPNYAFDFTHVDNYMALNTGALIGTGILVGGATATEDGDMGIVLKTTDDKNYLKLSGHALVGHTADKGMSIAMWAKASGNATLFSAEYDGANIRLTYVDGQLKLSIVGATASGEAKLESWSNVGLSIYSDKAQVYVDGKLVCEAKADMSKLFDGGVGYGSIQVAGGAISVDNVELFGAALAEADYVAKANPQSTWVSDWKIDFGPEGSPRWETFTMMYNTTLYKNSGIFQSYGFTEAIDGHETDAGGNKIRDFVYKAGGQKYTFKIDLPKGKYSVFVYTGNKLADNTTYFYFNDDTDNVHEQTTTEGVGSDNYGGPNTYEVYVVDNTLSITFWGDESLGADAITGAMNSLEITKLSDELPDGVGDDDADDNQPKKKKGPSIKTIVTNVCTVLAIVIIVGDLIYIFIRSKRKAKKEAAADKSSDNVEK